jgi:hypothetical protein
MSSSPTSPKRLESLTMRSRNALALLFVLCLVTPALAQQEMRSNSKGSSIPLPITGTSIDSNHNALDTTLNTLLACEDQTNSVCRIEFQWEYEDVAASQTDQAMGATGAAGDLLHALKCFTSAASVGAVTVKDGSGSSFTIFLAQSAAAILDSPPLDWVSVNGAWSVTTGTNTTCKVSGRFS